MASVKTDSDKKIAALTDKNRRLQKKLDAVTLKMSMQSKILDVGNLSSLQTQLDQLTVYFNTALKKISNELLLAEYDPNDTMALHIFRESLLNAYQQLGQYTTLQAGMVDNPNLSKLSTTHNDLGKILAQLTGESADDLIALNDEMDRLFEHVRQVIDKETS